MPESSLHEKIVIAFSDQRVKLEASLIVPETAAGLVIFAHGCGSGRHSSRNRQVAQTLRAHGLATLLLDLLTAEEERLDNVTRELRFNISLLSSRLVAIAQWTQDHPSVRAMSLGYFGSSTGAAAALIAAAHLPHLISAVVSRGGRPDLASTYLSQVQAPTLLLVGDRDDAIKSLNQQALMKLNAQSRLRFISNATHLFEEQGALEEVGEQAASWFQKHLGHGQHHPSGIAKGRLEHMS